MNPTLNVLRVEGTSIPVLRRAILGPYSEQHFVLLAPAAEKKASINGKMGAAISKCRGERGWAAGRGRRSGAAKIARITKGGLAVPYFHPLTRAHFTRRVSALAGPVFPFAQ